MKLFKKPVLLSLIILLVFLTGCSGISEDEIRNSSEVFSKNEFPESLMERISGAEAIVLGQYHGYRNSQDFLADFIINQHKNNNISQIVIGAPHAYSWIYNSYVKGEMNSDLFVEEIISEQKILLVIIREYNSNLAKDDMITVKTGDINFQEDQFISSLQYMRQQIPERDTINRLLNRVISAANRAEILEEFKRLLSNNKSNFNDSWGADWNKKLLEMIEVELESIEIRGIWDKDYTEAHLLRENLIKDLAEKRIQESGNTIFKFTFYQAQKDHYLGTRKEWLAEYLASETSLVESSYSFLLLPMSGRMYDPNNGTMNIDIRNLEENSLFKKTIDILGNDDFIYMDFNSKPYKNNKERLDLYYQKIEAVPYKIFDGAILLP
ncbi:MAG: hypothetical protein ABR596_04915 [Halarsenatibacteraceae bacterium]